MKKNIGIVKGPILEVGSKDYGNTQNLRELFSSCEYIGIDMESGKGVDMVLDLTDDFENVDRKLKERRFKTIICFCVLEHCKNPFKMCNNIEKLLLDGGMVFVSAPFSWRIHGYPDDYWRFTPDGIKVLFPNLEFDLKAGSITSSKAGIEYPIDNYMLRVELDLLKARERKIYGKFNLFLIRLLKKVKVFSWIYDNPYLFPPVNVNMIGRKIILE